MTLPGNEYSMQANLTHYDDLTQLEDDIISFLPTVSDIEVFGCRSSALKMEPAAPGCVQFSRRVFAECCSLSKVGIGNEEDDAAPGAQLGRFAFESCLTLTSITFAMDRTNKPRTLPDGSFCGAGVESLCVPGDFHNIGPRACENCKRLVEVNLMCAEITVILKSTFAHCVALSDI